MRFNEFRSPLQIDLNVDYGSAEGYVVDTSAEQVPNWLERNGLDQKYVEFIQEKSRVSFFNNMWVEEDSRGQGLGHNLVEEFIQQSIEAGAEAIYLFADTGESQETGFDLVKWYEAWGFEKIEENPSGVFMKMEFDR